MPDDFAAVADGPLLRERGLFVAEGRLLVRRVIDDPRYAIHSLLLNATFEGRLEPGGRE